MKKAEEIFDIFIWKSNKREIWFYSNSWFKVVNKLNKLYPNENFSYIKPVFHFDNDFEKYKKRSIKAY